MPAWSSCLRITCNGWQPRRPPSIWRCPADLDTIARWTTEVVAANECRDALIRIFALGATADNGPEIFIWPEAPRALPPSLYEQGAGAVTYSGERALPQAKSLNTLVNHMAKARALNAGEHEGVLVDR